MNRYRVPLCLIGSYISTVHTVLYTVIAQVGIYNQTNCSFLWKRLDFWSYSRKSNLQTSPWNGEHQPVDEKKTSGTNLLSMVVYLHYLRHVSITSKRWLFEISEPSAAVTLCVNFMHPKGALVARFLNHQQQERWKLPPAQGFAVQVAPSSCWISCNLTRIGDVVGSCVAFWWFSLWVGNSWYFIWKPDDLSSHLLYNCW